jgi:hypothetical protein
VCVDTLAIKIGEAWGAGRLRVLLEIIQGIKMK